MIAAGFDKNKPVITPKQYTTIRPVRAGVDFTGKIRFENLSDVELGALLFALDLPSGCRHKLGMGKPLGLGSVQISARLHLSDRKKRYTELFSELDPESSEEFAHYKKRFEKYVLDKLGESSLQSLWETERLAELKTMLDFKKGVGNEKKNEYMTIQPNEFKERNVLPFPSWVERGGRE